MIDTLFGLIPAGSRGEQWVAEELQLVNWGGYDGAHRLRFSPEATLLCGGSGSGKSTLMDAYIALMMPHTTPFNGASNGGVTGRARGAEQRNILSYGRGKLDESRTEEGTQVRVLRGDRSDTWTALAMTWRDHDGSRFTAVRAWYIPAVARVLDDTVRVRATANGPLDLSQLEQAAAQRLSENALRAAGLETFSTDREFSARIHSVLGIGASGAGASAMNLLARIQAGQQITTVDDLYKRMVLEEPETLATAEAVVNHFDELETTRSQMVTAQKQVRALRPIRDMRSRIEESAQQLRLIEEIGQFSEASSRAALWRNQRRLQLLRQVEAELRDGAHQAEAQVRASQASAETAEAERAAQAEVMRQSGGDRVESAERELATAERRRTAVAQAREAFDEATASLQNPPRTADEFAALHAAARRVLGDSQSKQAARENYAAARSKAAELKKTLSDLEQERRRTEGRADNIPTLLHETRERLAKAAGLSAEQLPFVGELLEVSAEYEPWREAFNQALGGFATTLLIDGEHLPDFRAAINSVRTPVRVHYEGAQTGLAAQKPADSAELPARLEYRESSFTGWLQHRLQERFSFVCVDSPEELSRHNRALTITGQLSQAGRGSHGGQGRRNVLGFSSRHRMEELTEEIHEVSAAYERAVGQENQAAEELDSSEQHHAAYSRVTETSWEQIDVESAEQECARWSGILEEISTGNPEIADLQKQISALKATAAAHQEETGRAKGRQSELAARWAKVTDEVDAVQNAVDQAVEQSLELSAEQSAYLQQRFGTGEATPATQPSTALEQFDIACSNAAKQLREDQHSAQQTLAEQHGHLRRTLENFLESWPNPNLRADPSSSLKDFEKILEKLETSGLHELETEWKNSLLRLSGNDLANLDSALGRALREIRERIEPINAIMEDLPYYDADHRLKITARENQSQVRRRFRHQLREVRGLIGAAQNDADREQAYQQMATLISRIRRTAPDFADLIDVRHHVRVSAEKIRADNGEHVALYDHIGEKSGGESQELIAFIVGAALRYQLGDAQAQRPRYAPVFLDEALIKADAHFTQRAIGAWRGLGFQLIIGAPNDKYSAIEPHVDVEYDILKDTRGRSWAKLKVGLEQP